MLTLLGGRQTGSTLCDGLSRRNFLKIGGLGMTGLGLPQLLQADAAGNSQKHKSVIMIYLVGGPPHQDMFDLKPDAPKEVAGPWRPIQTTVPGMEICEAFPLLAKQMDKAVIVRSIVGSQSGHAAIQCFNGHHPRRPKPSGGWPQFGSTISKIQGPTAQAAPPFVSLCYPCTHGPYNEPGPGFLGVSESPFRPLGDTKKDMVLNGVTLERLADRKTLLNSLDQFKRHADASGMMDGLDTFNQQAMGVLTSSKLAEALDLSKEDPAIVKRYGYGDPTIFQDGNGAPRVPQSLLVARRLVEAGARVVTLNYSKWDWHGGGGKNFSNSIFKREAVDFPAFDKCVSALLEDLHERGLSDDCTVAIWGEFGRTPKISSQVGRDHWPRVNSAFLFGGGMKTGQVIGQTDRLAGEAVERPVTFPELFATLYHNLGINAQLTTVPDFNGRPQYLVEDNAKPIPRVLQADV